MFQAIPCYQQFLPRAASGAVARTVGACDPTAAAEHRSTRQGLLKRPIDKVVTGAGAPGGPLGGNRLR